MHICLLAVMTWLLLSAFTLEPSLVSPEEIIAGGPPKDGIPTLTHPIVESADIADTWLAADDAILGIIIHGHARAYPIRILNWHEIVNDTIDGQALVITYCPLCGSGMAFDSHDIFGVSGLLYQSDVLLYDKKSESLWSQIGMQAITGPRSGERLMPLPVTYTDWKHWRNRYPRTTVLSRHTGFKRRYDINPYAAYARQPQLYFPIRRHDTRLPDKAWVIALSRNGHHKAWHLPHLLQQGTHSENWHGLPIRFIVEAGEVRLIDAHDGALLPAVRLYWFAWSAFHPDSELAR